MRASRFDLCLMNLRQMLPENWMHYMPQEEAYNSLKEMTGQDFGYDADLWQKWGQEKRITICFPPDQID